MDLENNNNQEQIPEEQEEQEELSKIEAITGIFTEPGNTFESINKVSKNYWLLPMIITIVLGLITSFLFFSDSEIAEKVMDKQTKKAREKMEENVKSGKMSQEQANDALEKTEKFMNPNSLFFKLIGYIGSAIGNIVLLFILSLIYLIFLKIMKAQFTYLNLLNVIGLAMVISGIGGLLNIVLSILTGDLSTLSLGLILKASSVGEEFHGFLNKIDIISIWFYIIISIGLVKIGKIKPAVSYVTVFGIWIIIYLGLTVFLFGNY